MSKRKLFIGSSLEAIKCARLLRDKIELKMKAQLSIDIWKTAKWKNLQSILSSIEDFKNEYYYAIFIFHPDDFLKSRGKQFVIVRDNVIFELGYFLGQLGTKRTFLLIPEIQNRPTDYGAAAIKQLSDLSGSIRNNYKINMHNTNIRARWSYIVTDAVNSITKQIKDNENTLKNIYNRAKSKREETRAFLESEIGRIKSELKNPSSSDEIYINSFTSSIDFPIRLKTALMGKSIQDTLLDLLLVIKDAEDIIDVWQLIKEQSQPEISEVWVFADPPIEYSYIPPKGSHKELRRSVAKNLSRGVKYVYFISPTKISPETITEGIFEDVGKIFSGGITENKIAEISRNIEIRIIDERFFLTFFTLHFRKSNDYDIFLSTLHPDRDDLMIKVREDFRKQIKERIDNLIIHYGNKPDIQIIDISGHK